MTIDKPNLDRDIIVCLENALGPLHWRDLAELCYHNPEAIHEATTRLLADGQIVISGSTTLVDDDTKETHEAYLFSLPSKKNINGDDEDIDYGCSVLVTEEDDAVTCETITTEAMRRRADAMAKQMNAAALRHMSEHEGRREEKSCDYPVSPSYLLGMAEQMLVGLQGPELGDIHRRHIDSGIKRIIEVARELVRKEEERQRG